MTARQLRAAPVGAVRNVFDQYEQLENQVTHSLATALSRDTHLRRSFLARFAPGGSMPRDLPFVAEQQLPGEPALEEAEASARGLPDAWIHDGSQHALLIESKVTASVSTAQITRHLATARRRGFSRSRVLLITAGVHSRVMPRGVLHASWKAVYSWLRSHAEASFWADEVAGFLEVVEARLMAKGTFVDTLTEFSGFPFEAARPYNYLEAKRLLRLALGELRLRGDLSRELGMDPKGAGRPAITGRDAHSVWDFVPLRAARRSTLFTAHPHLTLAVEADRIFACITLPNGLRGPLRARLRGLGREDLAAVFMGVGRSLQRLLSNAPGAAPWIVGLQRHYPSQRALPIIDARIEFDLRAICTGPKRRGSAVLLQPALLDTIHAALRNRRPNFQLAIGVAFPYGACRALRDRRALDLVAGAWLGCRPVLEAIMGKTRGRG